jgi:ferredoxin
VTKRLQLDPIRCDGHGICAELFPEGIDLDDWGYPIINTTAIPEHFLVHAKRAVFACPVLALKLVDSDG